MPCSCCQLRRHSPLRWRFCWPSSPRRDQRSELDSDKNSGAPLPLSAVPSSAAAAPRGCTSSPLAVAQAGFRLPAHAETAPNSALLARGRVVLVPRHSRRGQGLLARGPARLRPVAGHRLIRTRPELAHCQAAQCRLAVAGLPHGPRPALQSAPA